MNTIKTLVSILLISTGLLAMAGTANAATSQRSVDLDAKYIKIRPISDTIVGKAIYWLKGKETPVDKTAIIIEKYNGKKWVGYKRTSTGSNGRFSFTFRELGTYRVSASKPKFIFKEVYTVKVSTISYARSEFIFTGKLIKPIIKK